MGSAHATGSAFYSQLQIWFGHPGTVQYGEKSQPYPSLIAILLVELLEALAAPCSLDPVGRRGACQA